MPSVLWPLDVNLEHQATVRGSLLPTTCVKRFCLVLLNPSEQEIQSGKRGETGESVDYGECDR